MKRLVIVYSPNSARFSEVDKKVIQKARKLKGWMICKFEVKEAPLLEDAAELAKIIRKDDLVLATGGDGTAAMVTNAILQSGKLATLAVMPFGNFNDFATTLGRMSFEKIIRRFEEGRYIDYYPLDVRVNGEHYIYASVYFMVGMMAEAAGVMKEPKVRQKLKKARNRMSFSARKTFGWYVKNKWRKDLLPEAKLNGEELAPRTTDYVAMNGNSMIGLLSGGVWYRAPRQFWSGTMRNRSFWRMLFKFTKALEGELPGRESEEDALTFKKASEVFVHAEGENQKLEKVKEIRIIKTGKSLRVISV
ncbi:hypothetical protein IKF74_02865 [Candidatus Saccharibacteria bacterium]|nr:hypothetical protein [Candidatus Saccharibacteria bacterium]